MSLSDPATKQDLQELKTEILTALQTAIQTAIQAAVTTLENRIAEVDARHSARLERAENALLRGFRTYARNEGIRARSLEMRMHEVEQSILELQTELGLGGDKEQ